MTEPRPTPGELGNTLRELRRAAGLTGVEAAKRAGVTQPTISRYERGKVVPTSVDVERLTAVYGADAGTTRKLVRMVKAWRQQATVPSRLVMHRGAGDLQRRIGQLEAQSKRIGTFSPLVIPGLLQLREYAAAVFASGGDMAVDEQAKAVDARMERQELLDEPGRDFVLVLPEGAMAWQVKSPTLMAEQLDHVAEVSKRPNVRVGVIPWTRAVDVAPMHGFDVYDEAAAIVGTETATAFMTQQHDVAMYTKLFEDLVALAVFGDDARQILADRADRYRDLR